MSLLTKIGSFTRPGAPGNSAVTGVGFAPKAVILFVSSMTTDGAVGTGTNGPEYPWSLGLLTSIADVNFDSTDDYSTGGPKTQTDAIYIEAPANGGVNANALLTSLDADGFTLNWVNIDRAVVCNYLALGGSDLTNVDLLSMGAAPTATGNQAYTGVGFQPDAVILVCGTPTGGQAGGMGMFTATDQAANSSLYTGVGLNTYRYQRTDRSLVALLNGTSNKWDASLVSIDSDGFTLNWLNVHTTTAPNMYALCFKGGQYKVGAITEKTSNGSEAYTGVGFTPKAVFFSSTEQVASTSVDGTLIATMWGAAVSASERAAQDTVDNAQISTRLDRTKCLVHTLDSGGVTPTSGGAADLSSMDADGFTLAWTETDGVARQSLYMAFGDDAAGPSSSVILEHDRIRARRTSW